MANVTVTEPMGASVQDIWDAISNRGVLEKAHPFVEKNPVHRWVGVGSSDTIYYYSGLVMHRDFTLWQPGVGYDLKIGPDQTRDTKVSWRIGASDTNDLSISISNVQTDQLEYLRVYLESVTKGFAHLITTGNPVVRNQFGPLDFFSPAV